MRDCWSCSSYILRAKFSSKFCTAISLVRMASQSLQRTYWSMTPSPLVVSTSPTRKILVLSFIFIWSLWSGSPTRVLYILSSTFYASFISGSFLEGDIVETWSLLLIIKFIICPISFLLMHTLVFSGSKQCKIMFSKFLYDLISSISLPSLLNRLTRGGNYFLLTTFILFCISRAHSSVFFSKGGFPVRNVISMWIIFWMLMVCILLKASSVY